MGSDLSIPSRLNFNLNFELVNSKDDANFLLQTAERKDFYLQECYDDEANYKSRKSMTYMPNQIALQDRTYAYAFLDSLQIPQRLRMDLSKVHIIQLMPSADGGMPHTRPESVICLPDISQLFSKSTMIHELWHIHQRKYNMIWLQVFQNMGWQLWDGEFPEHLEKYRRYNPDTIDCPLWIYNDTWIPVPIFRDISKPKVNDVEIWFYNPHKKYHVRQIPGEISEYFTNLPPSAYEHPREITAYMLSEPEKYQNSSAFKKLIELIGHTSI